MNEKLEKIRSVCSEVGFTALLVSFILNFWTNTSVIPIVKIILYSIALTTLVIMYVLKLIIKGEFVVMDFLRHFFAMAVVFYGIYYYAGLLI